MFFYHSVPYTNFHELNLDWILMKVKELNDLFYGDIEQDVLNYVEAHLSQFILHASYDEGTRTIFITGGV